MQTNRPQDEEKGIGNDWNQNSTDINLKKRINEKNELLNPTEDQEETPISDDKADYVYVICALCESSVMMSSMPKHVKKAHKKSKKSHQVLWSNCAS